MSHELTSPARKLLYLSGVLCLSLAVLANYINALENGWNLYYVNRDNALIAVFSIGCFSFFRGVVSRVQVGSVSKVWRKLVDCGLIIYLIHPFFRLIMESLDIFSPIVDTLYTCPLIAVPVVSAVIWLLSFIAALVLKLCVSGMRTLYFKTTKD